MKQNNLEVNFLEEMDKLAKEQNKSRDDFIREMIKFYMNDDPRANRSALVERLLDATGKVRYE